MFQTIKHITNLMNFADNFMSYNDIFSIPTRKKN